MRRRGTRIGALVAGIAALGAACATPPPPPPPPPTPVVRPDPASLGVDNTLGNAAVVDASVSLDGRFVAFTSLAGNLSPDDPTDSGSSVFIRDRQEGTVQYVGEGRNAQIAGSGDFLSFEGNSYILVFDRRAGTTLNTYISWAGASRAHYLSDDGNTLVYGQQGFPGLAIPQCNVRDLRMNSEIRCPGYIDEWGEDSGLLGISRNTRWVLYQNALGGIALWDRFKDIVTSIPSLADTHNPYGVFYGPGFGATVSNDGRYLLGWSIFPGTPALVDLQAVGGPSVVNLPGATAITVTDPITNYSVDMTPDGRYVAVDSLEPLAAGDLDDSSWDMYVWDTHTGTVSLASKHLEDETSFAADVLPCFRYLGQIRVGTITEQGDVCLRTSASMVDYDTNEVFDAYIAPRP
jgi:hypothetical protein